MYISWNAFVLSASILRLGASYQTTVYCSAKITVRLHYVKEIYELGIIWQLCSELFIVYNFSVSSNMHKNIYYCSRNTNIWTFEIINKRL